MLRAAREATAEPLPGRKRYRLTQEQREQLAGELDGMGQFRNIVGFLGLLLLGKALPDAVFSVLKHLAKIRGSEVLDYGMLGVDATLVVFGAGMLYAAVVGMAPPPVPEILPPELERFAEMQGIEAEEVPEEEEGGSVAPRASSGDVPAKASVVS